MRWTLASAGLTAAVLTAGALVAAGGRTAIPALVTAAISPVASTSEVPYPDLPSVAAGVTDAVTAVSPARTWDSCCKTASPARSRRPSTPTGRTTRRRWSSC